MLVAGVFFAVRNYESFFGNRSVSIPLLEPSPTSEPKFSMKIGGNEVLAKIADTPQKRMVGLSEHESLPDNEGMLFVFEESDQFMVFWMKGMSFALDLIWIDDGKVVQIHENAPPQSANTPDSETVFYLPNQPINYVLEVNAGFIEKNNIQVGDMVELPNEILSGT